MFADYMALESRGCPVSLSSHEKGEEAAPIICVRASYLYTLVWKKKKKKKKDGNNGDNGLTYGRRGYEVVVLWYTSEDRLIGALHPRARFTGSRADRSPDASQRRAVMASNRDSVHSPADFFSQFREKKVKNGRAWKSATESHRSRVGSYRAASYRRPCRGVA